MESKIWLEKNCRRLLASSNGILVGTTYGADEESSKIFIGNPTTKMWSTIDWPREVKVNKVTYNESDNSHVCLVCGYGFGMEINNHPIDYTILLFTMHIYIDDSDLSNVGYNVHILTNGEFIMKHANLHIGHRRLIFDDLVACRDGLYVISDCGDYLSERSEFYFPYLFHYNVKNGTSAFIALPTGAIEYFNTHWPLNFFGWERNPGKSYFEYICLASYHRGILTLWVLDVAIEDMQGRNSWREQISIDVVQGLSIPSPHLWTNCFCLVDKTLVFRHGSYIHRYFLHGQHCGQLEVISTNVRSSSSEVRFIPYSTTLRPCVTDVNE
ncbi:uncharacterized protein [Spinacia oleracea]|uniref:F-box associated domain-containing protein n=1 Tax=Spinacia oleracea TaxID=3562 RepID=A0ABM3QRC3_SPIOL|nr:uncharacterized protein LOC130461728 [Spinacia oleracea]